jgi:hypothetical protein
MAAFTENFPRHFFLDNYIWEKADMVEALRQAASI